MARPQGEMTVFPEQNSSVELRSGVRLYSQNSVFVQISFSQSVTGFTASSITSSTASISDFSSESASLFLFTVSTGGPQSNTEHVFTVDFSTAQNNNGEDGIGSLGGDTQGFAFWNDNDAQVLALTFATGSHHDVVRLPRDYSITPTEYQRDVAYLNYDALPAGYTPWTHEFSFTTDTITGSNTSVDWSAQAGSRANRAELVIDEATRRLRQTDFMALSDETVSSAFSTYRNALRTIITNFNSTSTPTTVTWPEVPNINDGSTSPYPGDIAAYNRG